MEHAYSILMYLFAGALLLYAGLLAVSNDAKLIPRNSAVKMTDQKRYATQFAKVIALTALAPALSGIAGLWNGLFAGVVLVAGFVICIRAGVRLMDDTWNTTDEENE